MTLTWPTGAAEDVTLFPPPQDEESIVRAFAFRLISGAWPPTTDLKRIAASRFAGPNESVRVKRLGNLVQFEIRPEGYDDGAEEGEDLGLRWRR